MPAHEEGVTRLLEPVARYLRRGDRRSLWQALGPIDPGLQAKMEDGNDPLAVESAVDGSTGRIPFVDPTSVRCPATYYAGSQDWVLPHVRADVTMLGATLDIIPDQAHLGAFFAASETVLGAVGSRLRRDARDGRAVRGVPSVRTT